MTVIRIYEPLNTIGLIASRCSLAPFELSIGSLPAIIDPACRALFQLTVQQI